MVDMESLQKDAVLFFYTVLKVREALIDFKQISTQIV